MIQEIRTAIFDLHAGPPGATRLRQRLDEAIAEFSRADVRTTVQYVGPLSVIDSALADHGEAVVREALSNAVRHSGATELTVLVNVEDDLCIEVIDNGRGSTAISPKVGWAICVSAPRRLAAPSRSVAPTGARAAVVGAVALTEHTWSDDVVGRDQCLWWRDAISANVGVN